jgi:photosystem II oxygen-evolving enhancer protein 2
MRAATTTRAPARATTDATRKTPSRTRRAMTRATTEETTATEKTTVGRRDLAAKTLAAMALTATPTIGAFAGPALALSGMNAVKDTREGYEFLYPVGWQEIQVDGQAAVYKDIIEPLESVALNVYPTQRESVKDIGTADEVAKTLVGKALTAPGAQAKVLATSERTDKDGHLYYQFEFVTKTQSYERHALTVVTVTQGKFYTLTTGSSEKRWKKMKERLLATVGSFSVYY